MSENTKYKLTGERHPNNLNLRRIVALRNFSTIKEGEVGGYIESEYNLSHDGDCWISGNAKVFVNARVFGNAQVSGDARVSGNSEVFGNAQVFGSAKVFGNAWVFGNAKVFGNAWVFGNAKVFGNAEVYGSAQVFGSAKVFGNAWVFGNAKVFGNAEVYGNSQAYGNARVYGYAQVYGNAAVQYRVPVMSGLSMHTITVLHDRVNIGCESHTIAEWVKRAKEIADRHNYSTDQYELYLALLGTAELLQRKVLNNGNG